MRPARRERRHKGARFIPERPGKGKSDKGLAFSRQRMLAQPGGELVLVDFAGGEV